MSKDSSVTAKTVVVAQSGCEEVPRNVYQVPQRWCHLHCREKSSAPFSKQGQTEQVISQISLQNSPSAGGQELEGLVPSARRDQVFIWNPADCGLLEISWLQASEFWPEQGQNFLERQRQLNFCVSGWCPGKE